MITLDPIPQACDRLAKEGFALVPECLSHNELSHMQAAIEECVSQDLATIRRRKSAAYAVRNLLTTVPALSFIIEVPMIKSLVQRAIGDQAIVTRSILFDKNPAANWSVAWHQDTTIAVRSRIVAAGFGPWSVKAGIVHVQPPAHILEGMLTVRIHLDDCHADNGALAVLPGSHTLGILEPERITELRQKIAPVICEVPAGGVLLMKPLLLHSSAPAIQSGHRRVLHLEFARGKLPHGLRWNDAAKAG